MVSSRLDPLGLAPELWQQPNFSCANTCTSCQHTLSLPAPPQGRQRHHAARGDHPRQLRRRVCWWCPVRPDAVESAQAWLPQCTADYKCSMCGLQHGRLQQPVAPGTVHLLIHTPGGRVTKPGARRQQPQPTSTCALVTCPTTQRQLCNLCSCWWCLRCCHRWCVLPQRPVLQPVR
jgi:hypothetical protein